MGSPTPAPPRAAPAERTDGRPKPPVPLKLLESLEKRKCILFLGAGANAAPDPKKPCPYKYSNAPPIGSQLSIRLAQRCSYPYDDKTNLQRVSLFFQYAPGENRNSLVQAMQEEVYSNKPVPSPALHMLAALPFTTVITTNYDSLFDAALNRAETRDKQPKNPIIRVYNPNTDGRPESVPDESSEERPLLLKLHGDFDHRNSIVVTEEDYLNFIQKMGSDHFHPIHAYVRQRLQTWRVLFVGYSLRDPNFRLLFRALRWNVDDADWKLHFAVDPYPDDLIVLVNQRESKTTAAVSFISEDLWDFVPALYEEFMERPWP
jgi:hypothetical protein